MGRCFSTASTFWICDEKNGSRARESRAFPTFTPIVGGVRRWKAQYTDANGKKRGIGYYDTQEAAAHAVNAAIRRAGLEGRRKTNPVVDGRLVPRARKAVGHGPKALRKRRREELAAAAPSTHARRPRRAVSYEEDPDFEL